MKSILLTIILLYSFTNYGQSSKDSLNHAVRERIKEINQTAAENPYYSKEEIVDHYITENNTFQSLAQPSENSDLANHLKIYLDQKLLKKIDFTKLRTSAYNKSIPNKIYNYTIRMTFEINKKNAAYNFRLVTGNKELDKAVIEAFKKYPLEKLGITEADKRGKISIQLFARENKTNVIKASTFAVVDQLPVLKDCKNVPNNSELNRCLYETLFKYILQNISVKNIQNQDLRGEITISPRFSVDADGKIFRVNSLAPNQIIKDEIDRIIQSFDQVIITGQRNGKPQETYCNTYRMITVVNIKEKHL